jgi:hypothetical protein
MIEKELTFSWRWDNVEGVIEFYEAKQKPWIGDIQKRAVDLKEGAINAFATLFSQIPAGEGVFLYAAPTMEEPGMMSGSWLILQLLPTQLKMSSIRQSAALSLCIRCPIPS